MPLNLAHISPGGVALMLVWLVASYLLGALALWNALRRKKRRSLWFGVPALLMSCIPAFGQGLPESSDDLILWFPVLVAAGAILMAIAMKTPNQPPETTRGK